MELERARNSWSHQRRRQSLGHPVLHLMVGLAFVLIFSWPLFTFDAPLNTWAFLNGAWAAAIAVLFGFSRGSDTTPGEADDNLEHGPGLRASLTAEQDPTMPAEGER